MNNYFKKWIVLVKDKLNTYSAYPHLDFIVKIVQRANFFRLNTLAAAVSFYLLMALFPFLILMVSLSSLISIFMNADQNILDYLENLIPMPVYEMLASFLTDISQHNSLPLLSFGTIAILWAASKGFAVLIRGLHLVYSTQRKTPSSFFLWRALGLLFTFLLCISLLLILLLLSFGGILLQQLSSVTGLPLSGGLATALRLVFAFLYLSTVFMFLYRGSAARRARLRQALPGAILSAGSWIVFSLGFSWYVSNIARYSLFYGSVAGIVIMMLWLYFCCFTLLLGGVFNKELQDRRQNNPLKEVKNKI